MSAMPAEIFPVETGSDPVLPAQRRAAQAQAARPGAGARRPGSRVRSGPRPRPSGVRACSAALRAEPAALPAPAPVAPRVTSERPRLTGRGRLAAVAGAVIVATLLWFAVATAIQGPARAAAPRAGGGAPVAQIVVQPGQTLWSIAQQADPSADPRLVIQQIVSMNSLATENLVAGQRLRVP
jgi:LysM domain